MKHTALGIIETFGFIPAIEAADTALKTADVEVQGCRYVGAGLVSVIITGDISSVRTSVDSGKMAAERVGSVISVTVIGRTAMGLETVLFDAARDQGQPEHAEPEPYQRETDQTETERIKPDQIEPEDSPPQSLLTRTEYPDFTDLREDAREPGLETMSVKRLRKLARTLEPFSIARKKIKFARKDELVKAISAHYEENHGQKHGQKED